MAGQTDPVTDNEISITELEPANLDGLATELRIVAAWPRLPYPIRAGILAMIEATRD